MRRFSKRLTIWYANRRYAKVRNESTLTERVLIEATAEVIATVRMEHRGDIRRARELTNTLFDELAGECGDVAALESSVNDAP
jgi:hypothetical protein